jgi:hypothetical protein
MNTENNPPLRTAIIWAVITVIAIFGIFAPSLLGIDGFNGGFAISAVAILLFIIGIIVIIIYTGRARVLQKILNGENILAHWTYTPEEWQKYTEKQYKEEKQLKKGLFYIISGIAFVIGVVFFLADHENGIWVLVAMLALIAIIAFTAWFTSFYNYRQNKKFLGQTYITPKAIYLNRQLHTWSGPGDKLESVRLDRKDTFLSLLRFTYSVITRTGRQEQIVNIPVPKGKESEAEELVKKFNAT